jgi:hypothetical protein
MMFQIRVLTFTSHIDIMRCRSGSGIVYHDFSVPQELQRCGEDIPITGPGIY